MLTGGNDMTNLKRIWLLMVIGCLLCAVIPGNAEASGSKGKEPAAEAVESGSEAIEPNTGESSTSEEKQAEKKAAVEDIEPEPEAAKVKELKDYFEKLQNNPEYYGDPKFRKKLKRHEYMRLIEYKPNFGKKVWVKGWKLSDIKKKLKVFGKKVKSRKYLLSALEIADEVAPYVDEQLKDTDIDYEVWAERFEEFGRTYVNPSKAGKEKTRFEIVDFQNGNFIVVQAKKPFKRKMAYFIAEDYDSIIKVLLDYKEYRDAKKAEAAASKSEKSQEEEEE